MRLTPLLLLIHDIIGREDYCIFQWKYESEIKDVHNSAAAPLSGDSLDLLKEEMKGLPIKSKLLEDASKGKCVSHLYLTRA
jgi:hypothetical protein